MATDLEKLVVQLSADIKGYEREMRKAVGVSNQQARAIENRYKAMNRNLDGIGRSAAQSLIAPLAGISAALSVREVARYADAWTQARNALAVAGVTGQQQKTVLDQLYKSAQANGAPVTALAGLYGKAAQAADNLGATQGQLVQFSDGVAVSLRVAGVSATQASGALTQLGQLLGSARVYAEEFNSINEGARPILMAVAEGLDAAGGSVSKLKQLVTDGKVSGKEFFEAFLIGMPKIEKMAANATTTIDQGMTRVNNALTKYIGETDSSLGASQRLVAGLSMLADNFDQVADVTLKVAALIAGALVGRSMVGMIKTLGMSTAAVIKLVTALRAASNMSGLIAALGGVGAAAAPIGALIGVAAVSAMYLYSSSADQAGQASEALAGLLQRLGLDSEEAAGRVEASAGRIASARQKMLATDELAAKEGLDQAAAAIESLEADVLAAIASFEAMAQERAISDDLINQLIDAREKFQEGRITAEELRQEIARLAMTDANFSHLVAALEPLSTKLAELIGQARHLGTLLLETDSNAVTPEVAASRAQYVQSRQEGARITKENEAFIAEQRRRNALSKEALAIEDEVNKLLKARPELLKSDAEALARENIAADASRRGGSKGGGGSAKVVERFDDQILKEIEGLRAETAEIERLGLTYDAYGLSIDRARREAELLQTLQNKGVPITDALRQSVRGLADDWLAAAEANARAAEKHDDFQSAMQDFRSTQESAFTGLVTGAHDFGDAIGMVISKLAEMAASKVFDGLWGAGLGSASGGLLSSILGFGFASGGYTGAGGKHEPAGVVHRGEYVMDAETVRRAGGPRAFDALRAGLKGYAQGGYVGAPSIPSVAAPARSSGPRITINNNAAGVQVQARSIGPDDVQIMIRESLTAYDQNMPVRVKGIVANQRRG